MSPPLPEHRRKAVDEYLALIERHPEFFAPRPGLPLVSGRDELVGFATKEFGERGDEAPVVGVGARTPWHVFLTDVVRTREGLATYDRLVHVSHLKGCPGVAVVATLGNKWSGGQGRPGDVILVRQERHATGKMHWEIPRGMGEPGVLGEVTALDELRQEAGYIGRLVGRLATVHTNTGTTPEELVFYHVEVIRRAQSEPEAEEVIAEKAAWGIEEIWEKVRRGEITDAFTIQGVALLEKMVKRPRF